MSNTGDENKNYKSVTLTGGNSSSGDLILQPNSSWSNTCVGHSSMYANTTGSSNMAIGHGALGNINAGLSEEQAVKHMKNLNINVKLIDNINVTVNMYEYMTIKNLVNNEDKEIKELTKEEFDIYLVTIRV